MYAVSHSIAGRPSLRACAHADTLVWASPVDTRHSRCSFADAMLTVPLAPATAAAAAPALCGSVCVFGGWDGASSFFDSLLQLNAVYDGTPPLDFSPSSYSRYMYECVCVFLSVNQVPPSRGQPRYFPLLPRFPIDLRAPVVWTPSRVHLSLLGA